MWRKYNTTLKAIASHWWLGHNALRSQVNIFQSHALARFSRFSDIFHKSANFLSLTQIAKNSWTISKFKGCLADSPRGIWGYPRIVQWRFTQYWLFMDTRTSRYQEPVIWAVIQHRQKPGSPKHVSYNLPECQKRVTPKLTNQLYNSHIWLIWPIGYMSVIFWITVRKMQNRCRVEIWLYLVPTMCSKSDCQILSNFHSSIQKKILIVNYKYIRSRKVFSKVISAGCNLDL